MDLHTQKADYLHALTTFRSLRDEGIVESADKARSSGKSEILEGSRGELSGLESEQAFSAAMVAGFDRLNTVNLRREWSEHIKYGFYFMIAIQVLIIPILILLMFLRPEITFDKITPIIYMVIGESFIQIIGLVLVVVKFLFPPEIAKKVE